MENEAKGHRELVLELAEAQEKLRLIDIMSNIMGRIVNEPDTEPEDCENIMELIHQLCTTDQVTLDQRRRVQGWQINTAGIINLKD